MHDHGMPGLGGWRRDHGQHQWGNLKGKFVFDGKAPDPKKLDTSKEALCVPHNPTDEALVVAPDGGIKDVVIFVRTKGVKVNPSLEKPADKVEIDNKNCRFEPHILPLLISQTLVVKNSDPFSHNSNVTEVGGQGANPLIAPGKEATYKYARPQVIPQPVACNIHPWMKALFCRVTIPTSPCRRPTVRSKSRTCPLASSSSRCGRRRPATSIRKPGPRDASLWTSRPAMTTTWAR